MFKLKNHKLLHPYYCPTNHTEAGVTSAGPCMCVCMYTGIYMYILYILLYVYIHLTIYAQCFICNLCFCICNKCVFIVSKFISLEVDWEGIVSEALVEFSIWKTWRGQAGECIFLNHSILTLPMNLIVKLGCELTKTYFWTTVRNTLRATFSILQNPWCFNIKSSGNRDENIWTSGLNYFGDWHVLALSNI